MKKANLENPAQMAMLENQLNGKAVVKDVVKGSIADDCGIQKGDIITKINGKTFKDILDFKYMTSDDYYTVDIKKTDGSEECIEIYNDLYEQFGVEFENALIDKPMLCKNKCVFCFMDQLPHNVRKTMVFKDDDIRLSFLQGNYVTLTNLNDSDIERLIRLKVSPLNISVHVTDPETRVKMLSNPNAGKIMQILKRLADGGIFINGQIVLCKDINDGQLLNKTIEDLSQLYPHIISVSVVPVGLTKYRNNLSNLKKFEKKDCIDVINQVKLYQDKFLNQYGSRIVFLSDEFYLSAGMPLPDYKCYEDFPQIENGVGLAAELKYEVENEIKNLGNSFKNTTPSKKAIATSYLAYDFICEYTQMLKKYNKNLDVTVYKIKNDFFGENITVTGLLCGSDIINQLKGKINAPYLLLSDSMFKEDTELFLDDTTKTDVEKALGVKVKIVPNTGCGFVQALMQ